MVIKLIKSKTEAGIYNLELKSLEKTKNLVSV